MDTNRIDPAQHCVPEVGVDVPRQSAVKPTAPPQRAANKSHGDHDSRHVQAVVDRNAQLAMDRDNRIDCDRGPDPLNRSCTPTNADEDVQSIRRTGTRTR